MWSFQMHGNSKKNASPLHLHCKPQARWADEERKFSGKQTGCNFHMSILCPQKKSSFKKNVEFNQSFPFYYPKTLWPFGLKNKAIRLGNFLMLAAENMSGCPKQLEIWARESPGQKRPVASLRFASRLPLYLFDDLCLPRPVGVPIKNPKGWWKIDTLNGTSWHAFRWNSFRCLHGLEVCFQKVVPD